MPKPIVECVANYSDARRPEVIEAIMAAIRAVPGITILDRHSDSAHNRTVLTFVGAPGPIEAAAFESIKKAAELINLDEHTGEHPRLGASDVVPFVPISGVSMQDCVEIARRLGRRVGDELGIPVYLYEAAATRPERQNLENIRRGQYEALKVEMGVRPEREPDFGPQKVPTAGATVIGARPPLVAFNVYLTTDETAIAQKIAKAVRNSSGGLRFVKGLGLLVDGRAQVSMNLTNFRQTPIARVVETIRREAQRYGVAIHHSELVGLIPQEALVDAAVWYLQLDQFEPEQVLESKLAAAAEEAAIGPEAAGPTGPDFLDALAAGTPAPGGGSAAAHTGAAGAALVTMVARLTVGKKKYAAVEGQMQTLIEQAETLRKQLTAAVQEDAAAFEAVMAAFKLPKDTPEQEQARAQAVEQATLAAAQVPLSVAAKAVAVMALAVQAVTHGNTNAITDGGSGAALARAALTSAGYNVRINTNGLQDRAAAEGLLADLRKLETRAAELEAEVARQLKERGGLPSL
jgi:glutamate formiminotransferase/formiminotetrahydrofolate cyclodeaminase